MRREQSDSSGLAVVAVVTILVLCTAFWFETDGGAQAQEPTPSAAIFLPLIARPAEAVPTLTPLCTEGAVETPREWDPRLDLRMAVLISATVAPGECYWRLVKAVWYDESESQGRHHIFVDTRNGDDERQVGVRIEIGYADGPDYIFTEAKPGEPYAKDYAMYARAPAYSARPDVDGAPADKVDGMGLGSIEAPHLGVHTSYGLIWRWTTAPLVVTPIPTSTVVATLTPTATITVTATTTATAALISAASPIGQLPAATPTPAAAISFAPPPAPQTAPPPQTDGLRPKFLGNP